MSNGAAFQQLPNDKCRALLTAEVLKITVMKKLKLVQLSLMNDVAKRSSCAIPVTSFSFWKHLKSNGNKVILQQLLELMGNN